MTDVHHSDAAADPEDLWDFGTVRHPTVGRAKQSSISVSGPPLTWENNGTTRSDGSSSSGRHSFNHKERMQAASYVSSANSKKELPPSPTSTTKFDNQGTVRQVNRQREPSDDEYDDYDEPNLHVRAHTGNGEDDLPDTTMLDSVVLPAIASVGFYYYW